MTWRYLYRTTLLIALFELLVATEVNELKRNLEEKEQKIAENELLIKASTEKASIVATENVNLKASLDDLKTQNQVAEEKIKILNTVVEQRLVR